MESSYFKMSDELVVDDKLRICGLLCKVTKIDNIFHYAPNSRIRLQTEIVGPTTERIDVIIFLPVGVPVYTIK